MGEDLSFDGLPDTASTCSTVAAVARDPTTEQAGGSHLNPQRQDGSPPY